EVMKKLWTEKTVTYAGEFFTVPPVQLFPPPATPGGPPVLIGAGLSRRVCDRIIRCADGWIPAFVTPPTVTSGPATVREGRAMLDRAATDADRDPSGLQITAIIRGDQVDGDTSTREVVRRDVVERFAEAGADRVLVSMPTVTDEATARAALERIAASVLR
ncbi:MAG: LLM class flavin-dependent oxidoreductase, partial [Ilumatobacteraceae bacterium]